MIKFLSFIFALVIAVPVVAQTAPSLRERVRDNQENKQINNIRNIKRNAQNSDKRIQDAKNVKRNNLKRNIRDKKRNVRDAKKSAIGNIRADSKKDRSSDAIKDSQKRTRTRTRTQGSSRRDGVGQEKVDQVKLLKKDAFNEFRAKRDVFKKEMKQKREELKRSIKIKREELKNRIEKKKTELKERLRKIKDERKRAVVERINERIDALNDKLTNKYAEKLAKMEAVLQRIVSRADKAEEHGRDVSVARSIIITATEAISVSRIAVDVQSGKVYTITISDEDSLRSDVKKTRQEFRDDITGVRDTVKAVHNAIRQATIALVQIPKIDEFEIEVEVVHGHPEGDELGHHDAE